MRKREVEQPLRPRYIIVDGRRVLEPAEATEARRRKLNARMDWPEWYFREPVRRQRTPVAAAMDEGERI